MLELITGLSSRLPANLLQSSTYRCYLDMTARQKITAIRKIRTTITGSIKCDDACMHAITT